MKIHEIAINSLLSQAIRGFVGELPGKDNKSQKEVEELTLEAQLRANSLNELMYYLAFPEQFPDPEATDDLKYLRDRLLKPATDDKRDRSLVFMRQDNDHFLLLRSLYVNENNEERHESMGEAIFSLHLKRNSKVDVYFR